MFEMQYNEEMEQEVLRLKHSNGRPMLDTLNG